ncbi:MAG TPA: efflux RND transporter periplasmic adaptor subunit, partial [Anaeromyxobacteraceae bacterium]|nr:efflux RND transporter periplasmic adaptor subunit [Anaeromyxobacteraceae bacterium]
MNLTMRRRMAESAASRRDFETADDTFRKAKAEEGRALERLRLLRSGHVDAVTQEYTLPSHIEGRVVDRMVNPGVEVQGQFSGGTSVELFTVGDTDVLWLHVDVAQAELPQVRIGAPVTVRVLAYPDRVFAGKLEWVSPTLDPALRTARVRRSMRTPDGLLKPEMFVTAATGTPATEGLGIPRQAVVCINGQSTSRGEAARTVDRPSNDAKWSFRSARAIWRISHLPLDLAEAKWVPVLGNLAEGERVLVEESHPAEHTDGELFRAKSKLVIAIAEQQEVPHAVTMGGRLTFYEMQVTHVFSPVGGRIIRFLAGPGVKKGGPLALVSSPDLGSAFSDELKAKADLVAVEHERRRQREMHVLHASSEHDLEAAEDNYARVKAKYDRAEQKTRLSREGALDSVSQQFVLRSPIDGDVIANARARGSRPVLRSIQHRRAPHELDRLWLLADAARGRPAAPDKRRQAGPGGIFWPAIPWHGGLGLGYARSRVAHGQGAMRPRTRGGGDWRGTGWSASPGRARPWPGCATRSCAKVRRRLPSSISPTYRVARSPFGAGAPSEQLAGNM